MDEIITKSEAKAFLIAHDGVMQVQDNGDDLIIWVDSNGPGGDFAERFDVLAVEPDEFDLVEIQDLLGY